MSDPIDAECEHCGGEKGEPSMYWDQLFVCGLCYHYLEWGDWLDADMVEGPINLPPAVVDPNHKGLDPAEAEAIEEWLTAMFRGELKDKNSLH